MIMKRLFFLLILAAFADLLFAEGPELSGVFNSTVNFAAGAGDAPAQSWGAEEYANLRLKIKTGERAVFYSAVNLMAISGSYLENAFALGAQNPDPSLASSQFISGQNYAAGLELERLYFRINGDYFDTDAGLLRLPFGYGQVWGSSDFLNPRNPLFPDARPRGVLGTDLCFYPSDSSKFMVFAVAPREALVSSGAGFVPGFSFDQHWDKASIQALYAYETPGAYGTSGAASGLAGESSTAGTEWGVHRFGLSVKADLELGLVTDALYTLVPGKTEGVEGLSAGAGFDYSFLGGDLYILFEYLFNGDSSATAWDGGNNILGWKNHNYLYGNALYRFNDYTSLALGTVFCFDDTSFSPFTTLEYEVFQGFSLNLSLRLPLDMKTLNGGRAGELGPIPPDDNPGNAGARVIVNAGAKLRF